MRSKNVTIKKSIILFVIMALLCGISVRECVCANWIMFGASGFPMILLDTWIFVVSEFIEL